MTELLPCPFCGSEAVLITESTSVTAKVWCECTYCFAKLPDVNSEDKARGLWNSRVDAKPANATVSEFKNELGNTIRITIEGPTSKSTNDLTEFETSKLNEALTDHFRPVAQDRQEPVAWRWRPPGTYSWIYNPELEWLEEHKHEIECEPLFAAPYTTKRPQIPEGYYMVSAKCECVHAWQDGDGNYYCRGTLCNFLHSS